MENLKLSIIIPVYNAEKYLRKCLNNLLEQSYKNIEIIVVNDASQGNCDEIVEEYMKKDSRIITVKHEQNKGLFAARITGASKATGDYIAFLDSDDYTSIDYYRTLMQNAQKNNSDMVIGNTVLEYDDGRQTTYKLFEFDFESLKGEEGLKEYFRQEGLIFSWHTLVTKIYKKSLWDKASKHYAKQTKHLIMTEDFAFSTVLFYYANLITRVENDAMFYCKHEVTSTSLVGITAKRAQKNIEDLITSFSFVENFLKEVNVYDKYKENFNNWKILYCNQQKGYLKMTSLSKTEKEEILKKLEGFCNEDKKIKNEALFSSVVTPWNPGLEKIKQAICDEKIKCVSFDIFDTLVVRPFFTPSDLFILLNNTFRTISGIKTGIDFNKMRTTSEQIARNKRYEIDSENTEITLDEIYEIMGNVYHIEKHVLDEIKQKEIEYEIRFCSQRKTAYELYELALAKGKKVICISDMYLPKETVEKILTKNSYTQISNIYLSSETRTTKSKEGKLFGEALKKEKLNPSELLHIGDNYTSDYEIPKSLKINVKHFPRAINVFWDEEQTNNLSSVFRNCLPDWQDNIASMQFLGIRCMIAVVANRYFDNPYKSFLEISDFNADPFLIGYYALGMYLFGITNWLVKEMIQKKYDSIVFMARDGYLPLKAYEIMKKHYTLPKEKYLYVSRKSLIPITILDNIDLYKLSEVINYRNHTPQDVTKYLKDSLNMENFEEVCKENKIDKDKNFKNIEEFNNFMSIVETKLFNKEKHEEKLKRLKKYFSDIYEGKTCTFDIGYSGRPELFLSQICEKPIDTYFININQDEAIRHANLAGYELNTFFDYKPSVTGNINEFVLSALAPSCIGYNVTEKGVEPIFEEYKENYAVAKIIEKMQNAALEFVSDMMKIFGEDIKNLYYQKYYVTLPFAMYIHSAKPIDQEILSGITFEDNVRLKEDINSVELWRTALCEANQHTVQELVGFYTGTPNILRERSKPLRILYYLLYDRVYLKKKFKEKFKKHKTLVNISGNCYRGLKKIKHKFD